MDEKQKESEVPDARPKSPSNEDEDFEPSAEMMIHDFDDETTLNNEEDNDLEASADELADLEKEGEMPLDQLMALYGYGNADEKEKNDEEWSASQGEQNVEKENNDENADGIDSTRKRKLRSTSVLNPTGSDSESSDEADASVFHEDEWKKPRIGDEYQVTEIPDFISSAGDKRAHEEDQQVWVPWNIAPDVVEEYLKEVTVSRDPESLPTGCHIQDNEDALFLLTQCNNNPEEALKRFKSRPNPLKNELRVWSEEECKQFELGLSLYGKDFYVIHLNKVKTKSVRDIIKFYYIWKKSERYDHFTAKTRLGKKKDNLHPGVTDYMDRLLDETDHASTSSLLNHGSTEFLKYHPAVHSTALREHLQQMHVIQNTDNERNKAVIQSSLHEGFNHDQSELCNEQLDTVNRLKPHILPNIHQGNLQINNSNNNSYDNSLQGHQNESSHIASESNIADLPQTEVAAASKDIDYDSITAQGTSLKENIKV